MRSAVLSIGIAIGAIVLAVLAFDYWLLDEGEVVTLTTQGVRGETFETQVWLVDGKALGMADGEVFLRAHSAGADWLSRLHVMPAVDLERGDWSSPYVAEAVADPALAARLNEAMAEKYGLADRLLTPIFDPAVAVPVLLVPDEVRERRKVTPGH